ncbi:MAG: hypothetical protein K8S27_12595 [Candidatus Omnitrophica bacterium]|nr:hypothetical protein [Candidatus Omnitrophota bacterium]
MTAGYKYGWDDQHLEIPLLKNLIDPTLYSGDYYVESLKKTFSSFLYPLLSKLITVSQIPAVFFLLFLLSRYFLFFWVYKLWRVIGGKTLSAICCTCAFIYVIRVDEFLYRTFSHQEFALAIIAAGIYFFFKERFVLAAVILGVAANFHALYAAFPMFYMGLYLLIYIRRHGWRPLVKSSLAFILLVSPFVIWTLKNRFSPAAEAEGADLHRNWVNIYRFACPQNFFLPSVPLRKIFGSHDLMLEATKSYLSIIALFVLNLFFNPFFKKNGKAVVFCAGAFSLLALSFFFTNLFPIRFFVDLNLTRNTQFLLYMLAGFSTLLVIDRIRQHNVLTAYCTGLLFTLLNYNDYIIIYASFLMMLIFSVLRILKMSRSALKIGALVLCSSLICFFCYKVYDNLNHFPYKYFTFLNLSFSFLFLTLLYFLTRFFISSDKKMLWKQGFFLIPLSVFLFQYVTYGFQRRDLEKTGGQFYRIQRSWEDMQFYVKEHTAPDILIMVPYDMLMGGFRIHSERKILVSQRDCGIVGFDFGAALEWQKRRDDISGFKMHMNNTAKPSITNALKIYDVDYIVFLRHATPSDTHPIFQRVYTNMDFALFRVLRPMKKAY